jgi:hypothetical protein
MLFHNQNISVNDQCVRIYDDNMTILWASDMYSDIPSDNTEIVPILVGPLTWQTWSESSGKSNLSIITSPSPLEQLNLTNAETVYL